MKIEEISLIELGFKKMVICEQTCWVIESNTEVALYILGSTSGVAYWLAVCYDYAELNDGTFSTGEYNVFAWGIIDIGRLSRLINCLGVKY